jgi:drug/metabolite transporter (DMT)-like permease
MSIFLSALSALLYGCGDFAGGFASRKERLLPVMIVSQTAGLAFALAIMPALGLSLPGPSVLSIGALGGLGGAFGLFMLYRGLSKTPVAVVSPTSALMSAIIPLAFGLIFGERPSPLAVAGAALCLPAIFFLSWEKRVAGGLGAGGTLPGLLHGLGAGIGFGFFFIMMSKAGEGNDLWPLIAARLCSIGMFLAVAAARREPIRVERKNIAIVAAAGVLDMGANIAFLLASRLGLLMLASAVTSLYPAPTVLLARMFMGQKLGPARLVGIALAIAGTALIASG